ncbi:probable transmembrane ascorbate ferrireductase 3 isoform X2 [Mangifera indica]|uniref:probable transmembrane ascorbate ferrireductase 3 isoform X2 n=1 Tax=Mangifera indica TaxID=29780 RepID=UPI001CF998F5|nr:probable transmembrane ascorbate ferrireductase 3 isoform X2 [Mangifera indica]
MFTDVGYERTTYRRSASRLTIAAHLFGLLAFILMLVWLVHYREGIEYDSSNPNRVFNAHPFFMFCGFIFLAGEAMMGYKTVKAEHSVQKFFHAILHLTALCLGVTGICAVFKYHDMWLLGLSAFLFPGSSTITRAKMLPWHVCGGRALFYMAICAALTGLIEKFTYMGIQHNREARLINFTGLSILLYGIFVDLSVALARYV